VSPPGQADAARLAHASEALFGPADREQPASAARAAANGPEVIYLADWLPPEFGAVGQYALIFATEMAEAGRRVRLIGLTSGAASVTSRTFASGGELVVSRLRYLTANHASADEVPPEFRDGYRAYSEYRASLDAETRHFDNFEGYLVFTPEHLERFVTPDSMRKVCFVGSSSEVRGELDRMRDAGVDHASLQMAGDSIAWLRRMGKIAGQEAAFHG